jgi:hypothetical protein
MAYIGKSIESGTFSVLDTSGNTYNGSNVTFNLGTQVGSVAQLLVSHDGVLQKPGTDYTLATGGTQITFTTAPASGASIFIVEISGAVGGPLDSDLNGTELILDADGDTSITADTDDQIDIKIAGDDDFTFTASTLTVNSTNKICFNDATQFIQGASGTVLDIAATDEIELTSTLVDLNGNLDVSGTTLLPTLGVVTAKDLGTGIHIRTSDSGLGSIATTGSDELVIESSGNTGIMILSGTSSAGSICFGDSGDDNIGLIEYSHGDDDFNVFAGTTNILNIANNSLTINNAGSNGGVPLYVAQSTNGGQCGHISHTGTGQTADNLFLTTYTTGTGFNFIRCQSDYDSGEDNEWRVRGDGATLADGSYSSAGADYAEYFESKTGNTVAKGITVVMDGTKVKASTDSDSASSIVGVVRPKDFGKSGSVIGNAASNYWNQKYETDDFGSYVLEDVSSVEWDYRGAEDDIEGTRNHINNQTNVVSFYTDRVPASITVPADGVANKKVTTGLKRRKLNSSYDKTKTYTSREERDEWLLIGMLGQVQVTKGQKTGDRWIKMRDISETVEEWLIR